jgi:hypothetical protein
LITTARRHRITEQPLNKRDLSSFSPEPTATAGARIYANVNCAVAVGSGLNVLYVFFKFADAWQIEWSLKFQK